MKRLLAFLLFAAIPALSQSGQQPGLGLPQIVPVTSLPASCTTGSVPVWLLYTGDLYSCKGGVPALITGGGGASFSPTGLQYATSSTTARLATSTDLTSLLGWNIGSNTDLPYNCSGFLCANGSLTTNGSGSLNAAGVVVAQSLNGGLNPSLFAGSEMGAKMTAAIASIAPDPTSGQSFGEIDLDPAQEIYNISTTVNVPNGIIIDCHHAWLNWVGAGVGTGTWGSGTPVAMFTLGSPYTNQPNSYLAQGQIRNCNLEVNGSIATGGVANNVRAFYFGGDPGAVISPSNLFGAQWTLANDWVVGFYSGVEGGNNFYLDTILNSFFADNYHGINDDVAGASAGEMLKMLGGQIFNSVSNGVVLTSGHQWTLETSVDFSNTIGSAGTCANAEIIGNSTLITSANLYLEHNAGYLICNILTGGFTDIAVFGGGMREDQRGTPFTIQGYSIDATGTIVTFTTNIQNAPSARVGDLFLPAGLSTTQGLQINGKVFTITIVGVAGNTSIITATSSAFTGTTTSFVADAGTALNNLHPITTCRIDVSGGVATATFTGANDYPRAGQFIPISLSNCSVLNGSTFTVEAANLSSTSWQADVSAITTTPVSSGSENGYAEPATQTGFVLMTSAGGGGGRIMDNMYLSGMQYASELPVAKVVDSSGDVNANVTVAGGLQTTDPLIPQTTGYNSNSLVSGGTLCIASSTCGTASSVIGDPLFTNQQTVTTTSITTAPAEVWNTNSLANGNGILHVLDGGNAGGTFFRLNQTALTPGDSLALAQWGVNATANNSATVGMFYNSNGSATNYAYLGLLTSSGLPANVLTVDGGGDVGVSAHILQTVTGKFAGTCTMSTTSCTFSIAVAFNSTPICIPSVQGSTAIAGACSVSGTTVTITAASSNTSTWGAVLIGNPN